MGHEMVAGTPPCLISAKSLGEYNEAAPLCAQINLFKMVPAARFAPFATRNSHS